MLFSRLLPRFGAKRIIAVDFTYLLPGGQNGGVKPAVFAFLESMGKREGRRVTFIYIANEATRGDVEDLARPGDMIWFTHVTAADPDPGLGPDSVDVDRLLDAGVGLLYNPLGPDRLSGDRIPFICLLIDLLHRDLPEALPAVEVERREAFFSHACRCAAAIQVISDDARDRLMRYFEVDPRKLFRTYLPIQEFDGDCDLSGAESIGKTSYFIYPANSWPHKNHARLLEAFRLFLDQDAGRRATWHLVLTGADVTLNGELVRQIEDLGLTERVIRTGYLKRTKLLAALIGASGLIYPSLNEGFGIPILEAQQAGIPVACSNVACLPEVAGKGALYFDAEDVGAIARVLARLASDEDIRQKLIIAGKHNLKRFDLDRETRRFIRAMRSACWLDTRVGF